MTGPLNFDQIRSFLEDGPKPAPYRCQRCTEDALYYNGEIWLCTEHWQAEWPGHQKEK